MSELKRNSQVIEKEQKISVDFLRILTSLGTPLEIQTVLYYYSQSPGDIHTLTNFQNDVVCSYRKLYPSNLSVPDNIVILTADHFLRKMLLQSGAAKYDLSKHQRSDRPLVAFTLDDAVEEFYAKHWEEIHTQFPKEDLSFIKFRNENTPQNPVLAKSSLLFLHIANITQQNPERLFSVFSLDDINLTDINRLGRYDYVKDLKKQGFFIEEVKPMRKDNLSYVLTEKGIETVKAIQYISRLFNK